MHEKNKKLTTKDLTYIAMFAVILAVCAWVTIPTTVPFTLQIFGAFAALGVLGGKRGTLAILVYILLGAVGLPVFSGFKGGIHVLAGTTGGYIVGMLLSGLFLWLMESLIGRNKGLLLLYMVLGLLICYVFGTAWFMVVYGRTTEPVGIWTALGWCVFPFVIPDLVKIVLAWILTPRIRKLISEME